MKNERLTEGETSTKDQVNFQDLKHINKLIKEPSTLEEGFKALQDIDYDDFESGGLKMYFRYIKGKYYFKKFQISGDVEFLERANDQYEDIPQIGREYDIKPKKQQYLFVRIHTKYHLSKVHKGALSKRFLGHAKKLSAHAMEFYSDESGSFAWLHNQLEGH